MHCGATPSQARAPGIPVRQCCLIKARACRVRAASDPMTRPNPSQSLPWLQIHPGHMKSLGQESGKNRQGPPSAQSRPRELGLSRLAQGELGTPT